VLVGRPGWLAWLCHTLGCDSCDCARFAHSLAVLYSYSRVEHMPSSARPHDYIALTRPHTHPHKIGPHSCHVGSPRVSLSHEFPAELIPFRDDTCVTNPFWWPYTHFVNATVCLLLCDVREAATEWTQAVLTKEMLRV